MKRQLGGNEQKIAMCLVGAEWFWKSYARTEDTLLNTLLKYKMVGVLEAESCEKLMDDSIYRIGGGAIERLCGRYNIRDVGDIQEMLYVCMNRYGQEWRVFK